MVVLGYSSDMKNKIMIDKGEFFLKGYSYLRPISFQFNGNNIQLIADKNKLDLFLGLEKELECSSETGLLTITGSIEKDRLLDYALDIKKLLSFATGKSVIFDRQSFWTGETVESEEREMSINVNEGEQIIPDDELENFLFSTLPVWINLSKKEKDYIFIFMDYLNQTKHGYIEDRILRTVQAWESAARYWVPDIELNTELEELRSIIKSNYQKWKRDNSYEDKDGQLGRRITRSIDDENLILRLQKLIKTKGLNANMINLDLRELKNLRDMVAHTGRINIKGEKAMNYLKPGIMGLQLIILKRLGYIGLVNGEINSWTTRKKIAEYFER